MSLEELLKKYQDNCDVKAYTDIVEQSCAENRELVLGTIDEDSSDLIDMMIRFWNRLDEVSFIEVSKRVPIKLYIDSPGGEIEATLTIIDTIKLSKTPVYTIAMGSAHSGGLDVLISGHKRFSYPNATMMFHEGSIKTNMSDANKFANFASFYRKILNRFRDMFIAKTNISEEWYKEHQNDDVWMFPEEALTYGIIDQIITEFII